MSHAANPFAERGTTNEIETGSVFMPAFDANGLIACITVDHQTSDVLMFAWMNAEALAATLKTGEVHYWSRSRQELWHKGATSGQVQTVVDIRTDCDQDALLIRVRAGGDGGACHVGYRSCFYRQVGQSEEAETVQLTFAAS